MSKVHIVGVTNEGKRKYWTGSDWSDVITDSKTFDDVDDGRDEWFTLTKNGRKNPDGFRRVFVPVYQEPEVAKESSATDKILLNKQQKEFLWDALDMSEVYANENNLWSDLSTCIDKTWELVPNNDSDYPWTLRMPGHGDWDSITQDLADKVKNLDKEYELVQMPGTQGDWGRRHWGSDSAKESNDYIINVRRYGGDFEPIESAKTKEDGIKSARKYAKNDTEAEVVYMPENDIDTNDVVWNSKKDSATEVVANSFDIKALVDQFQKYLSSERARYEDVWYSFEKPNSFTVDVDGDWKHDHLYMDMLVEDFLNDRGLTLKDVRSITTEEDGSDWYRAERTYVFEVPKMNDPTIGQIAKGLNDKFEKSNGQAYKVHDVQIYNPDYKKAEESVKGQSTSNFSKSVYESIIGRR